MKLFRRALAPRSLAGRLMLGAAAMTLAALVVAGAAIGLILNRFVVQQLEQRLDAQMATVVDALERDGDGRLRLARSVDGPPFDRPRSGWYWRASSDGVELRSASLQRDRFELSADGDDPPPDHRRRGRRPRSGEGRDPGGAPLLVRTATIDVENRPVAVAVAAPWEAAAGPTRDALAPLVASLALLGLGLGLASFVQVRLGLKPLRALHGALADVRAGRASQVPTEQPRELAPLASELNALIEQNAAGLASARLHVANLAHGLKTPLATLGVALAEPGRDPDGALSGEIDRIERRIRHHLARARAAALGGPARMRTPVKARLDDLAAALKAIHAERRIALDIALDDGLAVACDPQDVDEMIGNLLDNAFKWASSRIVVTARGEGPACALVIADDGPGLPDAALPEALLPGRRMDETTPGHGFGLSIARELAELYGGGVELRRSDSGGLLAILTLPRVA